MPNFSRRQILGGAAALLLAACGQVDEPEPVTPVVTDAPAPLAEKLLVYSGRKEELIGPLLEQAEEALGLTIGVRYGSSAGQAAAILEEGDASPADVYFGQDAGSVGALARFGSLARLSDSLLNRVEPRFRSPNGDWVGVSGRARVFVYNTEMVDAGELPGSVFDLTSPDWNGRVGWAPGNGSFQAFISAMRHLEGNDAAVAWLIAMRNNGAREYPKNSAIVESVCLGEVDGGLVNHYYLLARLDDDPTLPCANHHFAAGDLGNLINVAAAGVVKTSKSAASASALVEFLLSPAAQTYWRDQTFEYPIAGGITAAAGLPPLDSVAGPEMDLGDMHDLAGTLTLLELAGVL